MVEQQVGLPDVRVFCDLAADRWEVTSRDRTWSVRRWTWGARQRLLEWARGPQGLDGDRLVRGLVDLLVEGEVMPDDLDMLASLALELHGVLPGAEASPLHASALTAARSFGWGPRELESQPIPAIDALLGALHTPPPAAPADDGWNRIVVQDD